MLANLALAIFVLLTALCLGSLAPMIRTATTEANSASAIVTPADATRR